MLNTLKSLSIEGIVLKQLSVNGVLAWKEPVSYKNWVFYSTESDGITIYNNGKGFKDGYRVRSSGTETTSAFTTITGYIPYQKGDKLYIYPKYTGENVSNAVTFFDSSFNVLGQITDSGNCYGFCTTAFKTNVVNGVSVLDISAVTISGVEDIAFVRISNIINDGSEVGLKSPIKSGSEMIITKNEEIPL